ncbi:UTP--glucose-1-phosphate uridylyltransferase GalU [Heliophilum fasciatum]|uniref:UTP--glucose-1-phosphate uridylyltransferase n=1 Tax=Heliophilum fasciatum TaxID=35700 RepID=A0A4R2RML6_9FIRM|nr:UTP--glucose-1-phosphate uridylyltransferase GalU [Heliophilum fasciatum]MCW2277467.1 UTP--glucose-1-phosphate uridylyltransferase [Heliophilum fasciatum]TCP65242.1 UDP-glucose pyrophosphorylase [Heliophilum fasciatum]
MKRKVRKAIIPAAGLGTRFLPATKSQPKEMLPIIDKPTIQFIIEEAIAAGIEDILIVTGRSKRAIEDHFDRSIELEVFLEERQKFDLLDTVQEIGRLADIHYVRQKEPLGLGHAIYCARSFIGHEPFAVMLGDDVIQGDIPCIGQMIEAYEQVGGTIVGVQPIPPEHSSRYGIVAKNQLVRPNLWQLQAIVEKPKPEQAPSDLAVMGRYIIDPAVFDVLASQRPGAGGEIQLTDAIDALHTQHHQQLYAYIFQGRRYDVGDRMGYLEATVDFALQRPDLARDFAAYMQRALRNYSDLP